MTRLLLAILMILAAAAMIAFAIANRTPVTVSFDPFDPTDLAYVATMPLYVLAFAALILGAMVGGIAGSNQGKRRRERRRLEAELGARADGTGSHQARCGAPRDARSAVAAGSLTPRTIAGGEIAGKLNAGAFGGLYFMPGVAAVP
jgi:uncharacterized integral membrane protein